MNKKNLIGGIIAAIASLFFFRTDIVFGKMLLEKFSPITVTFGTLFIAGLITLADLEQRHEVKQLFALNQKEKWHVIVVSLISAVAVPLLFFIGLKYTTGINLSLFINASVIIMIILGILFFREKITLYAALGILFMLSGIFIVATNGFREKITFSKGDLVVFVLALVSALSVFIIKKFSTYRKVHLLVSARCLIGSVVLGPIVLATKWHEITDAKIIVEALPTFIAYAFFVVLMGYLLEFWSLKIIPISTFGMIQLVSPIAGIIFATVFLKENLLLMHVVGGIFILLGLFVAQLHANQAKNDHHRIPHAHHIHHS